MKDDKAHAEQPKTAPAQAAAPAESGVALHAEAQEMGGEIAAKAPAEAKESAVSAPASAAPQKAAANKASASATATTSKVTVMRRKIATHLQKEIRTAQADIRRFNKDPMNQANALSRAVSALRILRELLENLWDMAKAAIEKLFAAMNRGESLVTVAVS